MEMNDSKAIRPEDFAKTMESFPCMFNVQMLEKPSQMELKYIREILEKSVAKNERSCKGKMTQLNVLTLIYFLIGDLETAKKKNIESLRLASTALESFVALGNQAHLAWYSSEDLTRCFKEAVGLKPLPGYDQGVRHAHAQQAYLLRRLGGRKNLMQSEKILKNLIEHPDPNMINQDPNSSFLWKQKYHLAIVLRDIDKIDGNPSDSPVQIFKDVAENATEEYLKSLAWSFLAIMHQEKEEKTKTSKNPECIQTTKELIDKALTFEEELHTVYKNCGMALKKIGDPEAIRFYKDSLKLQSANTGTHHQLGKCYADCSLTNDMDRNECEEKAIDHFKTANTLSPGNIWALIDLILMLKRSRREQIQDLCLKECEELVHNWALGSEKNPAFQISCIYGTWYHLLKCKGRHTANELNVAAIAGLNKFNLSCSSAENRTSVFDQIVANDEVPYGDKTTKYLFHLMGHCTDSECARQLLIQWKQLGHLQNPRYIEEYMQSLLKWGISDEALLIADIMNLREDSAAIVSKDIQSKILFQEAKRQLSQGLVSCKLLFHRLFDLLHQPAAGGAESGESSDEQKMTQVDVIILHDGPQWRPLLSTSTTLKERQSCFNLAQQSVVFDDVLLYLFNLRVRTNPWIPSLSKKELQAKLAELINEYRVKLILVLTDDNTSLEFLQMADSLLADAVIGGGESSGPVVESASGAGPSTIPSIPRAADVALIDCGDGGDVVRLPSHLAGVRRLRARDCVLSVMGHQAGTTPDIHELRGTEILDAYFLGSLDNALTFFRFLLPLYVK